MKWTIPTSVKDLGLESVLILIAILVLVIFLGLAGIGFIYPFPTYKYFTASVVYDNEIPVTADQNGIIMDLLVENEDEVNLDQPLVSLSNRDNSNQNKLLQFEILKARQELEKSEKLLALGSLNPMMLNEQKLSLQGLQTQQQLLRSKFIRSPYPGKFYFVSPPKQMQGRYLIPGELMGYIHQSDKKILRVQTKLDEFRRFKVGARMTLFARGMDAKERQMTGILFRKTIDRQEENLNLYGEINNGYSQFSQLAPGSEINVGILITEKSLFEAFFDYDLYGRLKGFIPSHFDDQINRTLHWIQE